VKVWFQNRRTKHKRVQSDDVTDDDEMTSRAALDAEADMTSSDEELVNVDRSPGPSPESPSSRRHQPPAPPASTQSPTVAQSILRDHVHTQLYPNPNPNQNNNPNSNPSVKSGCNLSSRSTQSRSGSSPNHLDLGDPAENIHVNYPISNRYSNPNPNSSPNCAPNVSTSAEERRHFVALSDIRPNFRPALSIFAHRGDRVASFGGATATMTSSFSGT